MTTYYVAIRVLAALYNLKIVVIIVNIKVKFKAKGDSELATSIILY